MSKSISDELPDESNDTELQHHLRNVWHDNFGEQAFIDEMEHYIRNLIEREKREARIDGRDDVPEQAIHEMLKAVINLIKQND